MSDAWTALRQTATLGTGRAALPDLPDLPTLPAREDAALALLDRAALLGVGRLAGRTALTPAVSPTPPAPPEVTPPVGEHAEVLLSTVLPQVPLLLAWLRACAAAGQHVPPRWLPELLDLTATDRDVRRALRPVLGERGAWLARQNPHWRFALPAALPDEDTWVAATPAVREELFRAAREADPDAARTFLHARFAQERAEVQERLLRVLGEHPYPADAALEDLLDSAASARSRGVRDAAAPLRARLPGTAYQARMEARLRALVHLPPEATGLARLNPLRDTKATLHNYRPDEDAARDGLPGEGSSAHDALRALLPRMHPEHILRVLGPDAALAVRRAVQLNALKALEQAHLNAPTPDLAAALQRARRGDALNLLPTLPHAQREAHALDWLQHANDWSNAHLSGLAFLPAPWSAAVSAAVLRALVRTAPRAARTGDFQQRWRWQAQVGESALQLDPHAPQPELPADVSDDADDDARQHWQALTHTLLLRRDLQAAFTPKEPR